MRDKRGQQALGMSFGMIFSIFLIVVFVVIAIIAATFFLDIWDKASSGLFYSELQKSVDDSFNAGGESSKSFKIDLPGGVEKVCFANLSIQITNGGEDYEQIKDYYIYPSANLFLIPPEEAKGLEYFSLEHIDLEKIIGENNPYCVSSKEELRISKGFYDSGVLIQ